MVTGIESESGASVGTGTPGSALVGSAVRIVIRQERTCRECRHFKGELGRTGRVVSVRPAPTAPSHPYLVVLDKMPDHDSRLEWRLAIVARHFAADELEPIA